MNVGINGFEAVVPRFGFEETGLPRRVGSSEFCFQLLKYLNLIDSKNKYFIYLPQEPTDDLPKETENWTYKIIPNTKLWTLLGLNRDLIKPNTLDVFFSPTHYAPIYAPCPQVVSILDVSYRYFPDLFPKKDLLKLALWGKYSINIAKKIITISESSKNDIINEYKVSPQKVRVVPLGVKDVVKSKMKRAEFIKKYDLVRPFVLFVGTLQPRKNVVRLIESFSKIDLNYDLVIVGKKGWDFDEILEAPKKYGVQGRVKFLENVTNEDLPLFYENAEVFVLPSLYEGFGLPVLEAMKYKCPVVTSNVSSLPEAGGNAALYFDPHDPSDIASKINRVLKDENLKKDMIRKGNDQLKKFSWEKSAHEVLKIIEEVAKNG